MTIEGEYARLRVGYQQAAIVQHWSLTCSHDSLNEEVSRFSGRAAVIDQFWATQAPFRLGLRMDQSSWWVWETSEVGGPIELGSRVSLVVRGLPCVYSDF